MVARPIFLPHCIQWLRFRVRFPCREKHKTHHHIAHEIHSTRKKPYTLQQTLYHNTIHTCSYIRQWHRLCSIIWSLHMYVRTHSVHYSTCANEDPVATVLCVVVTVSGGRLWAEPVQGSTPKYYHQPCTCVYMYVRRLILLIVNTAKTN